jgi:hypothetical protein
MTKVRIILTVPITLSVCPFNCMAHAVNRVSHSGSFCILKIINLYDNLSIFLYITALSTYASVQYA